MKMARMFFGFMFGVLAVLGMTNVAMAQDLAPVLYSVPTAHESFGSAHAKFTAELAYMAGPCSTCTTTGADLTAESNGFRMTDMVSSGVAMGVTGIEPNVMHC